MHIQPLENGKGSRVASSAVDGVRSPPLHLSEP